MSAAPKLPPTEPTIIGKIGKAWRMDVDAICAKLPPGGPPRELTVCGWIAYAPYAHPCWHSYEIACISLRDVDGWPAAKVNLEGATHEVIVMALNPDAAYRIDEAPRVLTPANFVGQFIEPSDEAAAARIEQTVRDVVDGVLNPDTDYAQWWIHRFSASNVKGDPKRVGETRIVTPTVEIVIPPVPGPQDMH